MFNTIKDGIIKHIENKLNKQNAKGLKEYGQTLDHCDPNAYDWNDMANDELVDACQYFIKENRRLKAIIRGLELEKELNSYGNG